MYLEVASRLIYLEQTVCERNTAIILISLKPQSQATNTTRKSKKLLKRKHKRIMHEKNESERQFFNNFSITTNKNNVYGTNQTQITQRR